MRDNVRRRRVWRSGGIPGRVSSSIIAFGTLRKWRQAVWAVKLLNYGANGAWLEEMTHLAAQPEDIDVHRALVKLRPGKSPGRSNQYFMSQLAVCHGQK